MRRFLLTFILCLAGLLHVSAQEIVPPPFHPVDDFIKKNKNWWESRKEVSELFQQERLRLKDRFEAELWKYIGDDHPRYFWTSLFLDSPAYLHGHDPLPELAFAIRQKGVKLPPEPIENMVGEIIIKLNPNREDVASILQKLNILTFAAVSAEKTGNHQAALAYKEERETLLSKNSDLTVYLDKLSEYNSCIYSQIGAAPESCKGKEMMEPAEGINLKPMVVDGKALYLPQPERPNSRLRGSVKVELIIDDQGKVISAKAKSVWPELNKAAEEAALKAIFSPTTFLGRPLALPGVITFNFK